jgi:hypothetical protein
MRRWEPEIDGLRLWGGIVMANYRLFILDGHNSAEILDIIADDDLDAVECARKHQGGHPLELWRMGRRIKRFSAKATVETPGR